MERALVVVDDRETGEGLLTEVGEIAGGVNAEVVAVTLLTEEEYSSDIETLQQIGNVEHTNYEESPGEFARNIAESLAAETIGSDVEYSVVGGLVEEGDEADRILEIARDRDCDYIYLNGKRRSPTGKALFGDRAQKVLLNFDDYVTVKMEE